MPDWLRRPEEYAPRADRDRFIEGSIVSCLSVLAGIRNGPGAGASRLGRKLHPALRLVFAFTVVLLVSLSRSVYFLAIVGTLELVVISCMSARAISRVLKTSLVAALFAFAIFLPSALWGNWPGVLAVASKVLLSVAAASLVSLSMGWASISRGLSSLRLPDTFVLVLDLAVKYISLLGGLVLDMLYALKLRSVGRNHDKTSSLSGVAGTTFLRSREAAEEQFAAMECRGFSGTYRVGARKRPGPRDLGLIALGLCLAALFAYLQGA